MSKRNPQFLPIGWDLPEEIRRRLGDEAGRQRLLDEDGHLLVLLNLPPKAEHDEVRYPAVFWRNASGEWRSSPAAGGLVALSGLLNDYQKVIANLDERAETASSPHEYHEVMRELGPLHRSSRNMLAVMEDMRKARPDERELIVLRDRAVSVERAADMAVYGARTGLEFMSAVARQTQAKQAHQATLEARRLNRLAAFFFPLATIAAVFGMNRIDEVVSTPGFAFLVVGGLAVGFIMSRFVSRKSIRYPDLVRKP